MIDDGSTDRTVEVARAQRGRAHRPADQQQGPGGRLPGRARRLPEARRRHRRQHRRRQPVQRRRRRRSWWRRSSPARPTWSSATARSARSSTSPARRRRCSGSAAGSCGGSPGTEITDTTSGFRAYNREAALQLLGRRQLHLHAGEPDPGRQDAGRGRPGRGRDQPADPRVAAVRLDRRLRAPQRAARSCASTPATSRCGPSPPPALVVAVLALAAWMPFLIDWIFNGDCERPHPVADPRRGPLHRRGAAASRSA